MRKLEAVPFSSPELAEAFDRVSGAVSNLGAKLDSISNDIKALEAALTDLGVAGPTRVPFGEVSEQVGAETMRWREYVMWGPNEDGRRRLYYETICIGYDEPINHTPLIETKRDLRIRAHKVLPELVLKIGATIDPDLAQEASNADESHEEES